MKHNPINPQVTDAIPQENYCLALTFSNGEQRLFDLTPYLDKGVFKELRETGYFRRVRVVAGSIEWPNEQDLSYDTLYLRSVPVQSEQAA